MKSLNEIKHGDKVVSVLVTSGRGSLFVDEIRRATGLDDKTLRTVMNRLHKSGFIAKNNVDA